MKIGILTYHFSNNYGAVLQTYALQEKIRQLGHSSIIIDRTPIKADFIHKLYRLFNSNSSLYWRRFRQFSKDYLTPCTKPFYNDRQLENGIDEYELDAVIVGSDQIWRGTMCGHAYFLSFLPDNSSLRRISYAASFGKSEWDSSRKDTSEIKDALCRFDHISVRENTGVGICKNVFGVNAQLTLDPTLLHDRAFYETLISDKDDNRPSRRVVSYILGKSAIDMVKASNRFAHSKGLEHIELYWLGKDLKNISLLNFERLTTHITVEEWLKEIKNAEYVVTNSFHCVVFSIIFRKKFVVIEYASGGNDRLATLLTALGLENRIVSDATDIDKILSEEIDYDNSFSKLIPLKERSEKFLLAALR